MDAFGTAKQVIVIQHHKDLAIAECAMNDAHRISVFVAGDWGQVLTYNLTHDFLLGHSRRQNGVRSLRCLLT